jgi:transcriptional regulator with XRE-family HTH domain
MADKGQGNARSSAGETSKVIGRNVARLRGEDGISARALAEKVSKLGVPMSQSGISDIERGARTVSADQLTGLAVALRVSPVGLLMPYSSTGDLDEECSLTGVKHELSTFVLSWLLADEPFTDDRSGSDEARAVRTAFRRRSLPPWAWRSEK